MRPLNVRRYSPEYTNAVVSIFSSNVPRYFSPSEEAGLREFLIEHGDSYYLIELDGEVVGSGGIALNNDNTVSLCWGMVRADHLGTGLGKKLTEFRIQIAQEKFGGLPLVISTSQHTRGFYEKLGFIVTEHIPNGFGPDIDICRMRKEI